MESDVTALFKTAEALSAEDGARNGNGHLCRRCGAAISSLGVRYAVWD